MKYLPVLLLLVPNVAFGQLVTCSGTDCDFCDLAAMVNNIIIFLFSLLAVIAVIMLAYAGIKMVTSAGNTAAVQEAKQLFFNVVIGFIIVLAAWVIVDTILKALVRESDELSVGRIWEPVNCGGINPSRGLVNYQETVVEPAGALTGTYTYTDPATGETVTVPVGDSSIAGSGLSNTDALTFLNDAGIEYKDSVSGEGVRPHVISQLVALDQTCNCNITVTSLTDGNHASGEFSHSEGFKADLRTRDNPDLVNYVQTLPSAGSWSDGTPLYYDDVACATYAIEDDHIDVAYRTGC